MMTGETVYIDGVAVDGVLVNTSGFNKGVKTASDITDEVGPVSDFVLYFPSDYSGELLHKHITVRGIDCEVINAPAHEEPERVFQSWLVSPGFGQWDMVVYADRTRPEYAETITVLYKRYTRDALGDRTLAETQTLYSGTAQVRYNSETETDAKSATRTRAEYYFVTPHITGIDALPTQCLTVEYDGGVYDVESVENINEKDAKTSMRAVRHG